MHLMVGDSGKTRLLIPGAAYAVGLAIAMSACDTADLTRGDRSNVQAPIVQLHGEASARFVELSVHDGRQLEFSDSRIFFHGVIGGFLAGDRIVIGNRFSNQVLFFDTLGVHVSVFGQAGGGPGEFADLSSVVRVADGRIAAFDARRRRTVVINSNGSLVRSFEVRGPDRSSPIGLAGAVGELDGGTLLIWAQVMPGAEHSVVPDRAGQVPVMLFGIDSAGNATTLFGEFPGQDVYMARSPQFGGAIANLGPAPFGRWTRFGVYSTRAFVFANSDGQFDVYAANGNLVSVYRAAWPVRKVTREDRERTIDEWVKRSPRRESWPERRERFGRMSFPTTMPAYRDAIVGTDGIVWIEPYSHWNGKSRLFIGYDSSGLAIGKLALAYNERILQIGNCRLLIVGTNEDGTEAVRLHHLRF